MGSWQARDVAGLILLLLVLAEGGRKWVSVSDLSRSQAKEGKPYRLCANAACVALALTGQSSIKRMLETLLRHCWDDFEFVQIESLHDPDMNQIARRLLTPARPGSRIPALCETSEPECGEDVSVKCTQGGLVGCDCDFIQLCYPHVSGCIRSNSTHTMSCGF